MTSNRVIKVALNILIAVFFFAIKTQFDILQAQTFVSSAPDEIIVTFKKPARNVSVESLEDQTTNQIRQKITAQAKKRASNELRKINGTVMKVPSDKLLSTINLLKNDDSIASVEPNYKAHSFSESNDPSLLSQWGLYKIEAAKVESTSAWDVTHSSSAVKVAVLDTGIEITHPDLQGKVILEKNFTTSNTLLDIAGHGTHIAGSIGALTNNGVGVAGVGYDTVLMNGKVLDDTGSGYYDWIASGIIWAADNGAQVINLSLGGSQSQQLLKNAVDYAWNKGVVIVAAAGNSGNTQYYYPARYDNVISVAATDQNDSMPSWSTHGTWVKVAAPGDLIYATYKGGGYAYMRGTSMATSVVSGIAALAEAAHSCSNTCIVDSIEKSADPIAGTGINWQFGRVNAYKAVTFATVSPTAVPSPTVTVMPTPIVSDLTPTPTTDTTPTPTPTAPTETTPSPTLVPTSTPTPLLTPTPTPIDTNAQITVTNIAMSYIKRRNAYDITTRITVKNQATSAVVSNAAVSIQLTTPSLKNYTGSGNTNSSGKVSFTLRGVKDLGAYKTTITNVTKNGFTYVPTVTSSVLQVP